MVPNPTKQVLPPALLPEALAKLGYLLVRSPDFQENAGTTFCNYAVRTAALMFGCTELMPRAGFDGTANAMCEHFERSPNWSRVSDWELAQQHANYGRLVVAALRGKAHGHVCILVPHEGEMPVSGAHKRKVPMVANVGPARFTGLKHLGFAFSPANTPTLYLYHPKGAA